MPEGLNLHTQQRNYTVIFNTEKNRIETIKTSLKVSAQCWYVLLVGKLATSPPESALATSQPQKSGYIPSTLPQN
jgi:hypothetical protein